MDEAHQILNAATGGRDVHVPISLSTLVLLLDGNCPDKEDVIQFYEEWLREFPQGLAGRGNQ